MWKLKLDIYRSTMWLLWCYANIDVFIAREKLALLVFDRSMIEYLTDDFVYFSRIYYFGE